MTKVTKNIENEFLSRTAKGEAMIAVCRALNVSRMTIYRHAKRKTKFAEAWAEAKEDARLAKVNELEMEADRRAVEGVTVGVFRYQDKNYLKKRFSDTLLLARLKALDQETYGDKSKIDGDMRHEHSGPGGTPLNVTIDWGVPPDEDPET